MLLYLQPNKAVQAPTAPDGSVVSTLLQQVVSSKDPARAIVYQASGNVYRYVQGAFVADATKPTKSFAQVNCSPDGRYVSTSYFGGVESSNFCSTQDASGKWVTSTRYCPSGPCALSQVADKTYIEILGGSVPCLRVGDDSATAKRTPLGTTKLNALAAKASLDFSVVAIGGHYNTGRLYIKQADGSYAEFDSKCLVGYNAGFDLTADGNLALFSHKDGVHVFARQGNTFAEIAKLPVHYAAAISNDGNLIAGVSPGQSAVFYKRTGPTTWTPYRTTTEKGASLSNSAASCCVDPDGRYVVSVMVGKGAVFYHA